jgi:hypothetical protein
MFARADTLAFGAGNAGGGVGRLDGPGSPPMILRNDSMMSQSSTNGGGGIRSLSIMRPGSSAGIVTIQERLRDFFRNIA